MAGSGSDFIAYEQTWLNGNPRTIIQNGGNSSRNRPTDWTSSAIRKNGIEIRNEWKRGERQVVFFPWTPTDSVAFEFQKCRCAECIRSGIEAQKEPAVDRNTTATHKNQVRSSEVNRAASTQIKNLDLPLRKTKGHGYEPRNVYDSCPHETYADQYSNYGSTGCKREVSGREPVTHLLNPARPQRAEPAATSRLSSNLVGHTAKDKTMKDYVRCFENSFSNAIRRDQSERISENAGAPITNATVSLMRKGVVYSEASKHILSYRECQETHPSDIVASNTTSTYLTRNAVVPYVPASVKNNESHFLHYGLHFDGYHQGWGGSNVPLRMRREVETKPTSQTNCIQNAAKKIGCDRSTFPEKDALKCPNPGHPKMYASFALKCPINQRSDQRSENWPEIGVNGNVSLIAKADVPNMSHVDVFCNKMEGFQKTQSDHKEDVEETKKPEADIQRTMLQSGKGIKRTCPERHQNGKAKHRRRTMTKSPCVEKDKDQNQGSCPDSAAEQTMSLNSGRNASEKTDTCPPSNSKTDIGQEEKLAREASKSLKYFVNVKRAEEISPHPKETMPLESHESRTRKERIRNLKKLQVEQEQALDKLLINRPKGFESEFTCDLENECVDGKQGTLSSHQKPTQHPNQSAGKDSCSKKTAYKNNELAGNDSESSELNQVIERRTAKCKSPKKRWLKIWKASDRISGKKTKKKTKKNIIKKKQEASSTDENQNLSTDEYTALMGLVNLSKV